MSKALSASTTLRLRDISLKTRLVCSDWILLWLGIKVSQMRHKHGLYSDRMLENVTFLSGRGCQSVVLF